eukprot:scaffold4732_cov19-Tisochrysis_lutea.AAC.2
MQARLAVSEAAMLGQWSMHCHWCCACRQGTNRLTWQGHQLPHTADALLLQRVTHPASRPKPLPSKGPCQGFQVSNAQIRESYHSMLLLEASTPRALLETWRHGTSHEGSLHLMRDGGILHPRPPHPAPYCYCLPAFSLDANVRTSSSVGRINEAAERAELLARATAWFEAQQVCFRVLRSLFGWLRGVREVLNCWESAVLVVPQQRVCCLMSASTVLVELVGVLASTGMGGLRGLRGGNVGGVCSEPSSQELHTAGACSLCDESVCRESLQK